ncbi:MAG: OmpA family protein [Cyclobacteriaceae bacterium]
MKLIKIGGKGLLSVAMIFVLILGSCNTSRTFRGGAIGAGAGGVIGGAIGSRSGNTATGAILGAAIGGTAGALIGRYMDKQAEEIQRDLKGATVERVGEGIKITFDSGILFDVNKHDLKSASRQNLTNLAATLNKYEDTEILIEGHTDSTGGDELNQRLSERRAGSVAEFLRGQSVSGMRMRTIGYGKDQPIASNETLEGRAQNRRVEVAIYANDKLKKAAKRGDI